MDYTSEYRMPPPLRYSIRLVGSRWEVHLPTGELRRYATWNRAWNGVTNRIVGDGNYRCVQDASKFDADSRARSKQMRALYEKGLLPFSEWQLFNNIEYNLRQRYFGWNSGFALIPGETK